jgi:hypothetical protein
VIKKTSTLSLENIKENKLSIQFNLDGFSFSIYSPASKKVAYFREYAFENSQTSPENLLLKIEAIFKTDPYLQNDFGTVLVIHQNNLSTLVPDRFFDEKELTSYLNFNIKTLATDFISFDAIEVLDAKNIYIPYVNINNYLFQNFGEFEYKHHSSVLIENLLKNTTNTTKTMYVNVSKTTIDVVVLEKEKLVLFNTFSYNSKEDFIYYVLFVSGQLNLDVHEFPLYFMGNISLNSNAYKITYQYIKNVYFLESTNTIFNAFNIPSHSNYILLGS